ncbi:5-bromo-4-chloroindolyl phosphate hydrolysis family protein [Xenorhabdus hominickii]|nr:5-bromo-4-chloroindolyl phosphate hydrolysis family protein [Xenorhabdus hominickii]PHM55320.1 hypothetical protein Xhom_02054 [Xenorhabdus hominickii]PHM57315.1 hypothetical protein Xhom_00281 [Xenorhabdus hominickii]
MIKAFFWRLLFHGIGIFTGFIVCALTINLQWKPWGSDHSPIAESLIFFSNYVGMVALWAPQREKCTRAMQYFVVVLMLILCWFADLLPVFVLLAGFAMLLIKVIGQRKVTGGRFLLLVIVCIHVVSLLAYDLKPFPTWFCITYVVLVILLGCAERTESSEDKQKEEKLAGKTPDKSGAGFKDASRNKNASETVKMPSEEEVTSGAFSEYYQQLTTIMAYQSAVPRDIWPHLNKIEEKTRAIIACMKEDERDVPHGTAFLSRYLPMIKSALESLALLKQHQASSSQFQEAKLLTVQSLQDMGLAFSEMHQKLLDNNFDDLVADLKSMTQLVRAQGFDVKQ